MTALAERNTKIAAWARDNPCSSLQEIGDYYGITRERARQIIKMQGGHKLNASTANRVPEARCDICGKPRWKGGKRLRRQTYRCRPCRVRLNWVEVSCSLCGDTFKRRRAEVLNVTNRDRCTFGFTTCSDCEPKRKAAVGRALGRLPAGKSGRRESNPELFKKLYMQELGL